MWAAHDDYWTPEREAEATPLDVVRDGGGEQLMAEHLLPEHSIRCARRQKHPPTPRATL